MPSPRDERLKEFRVLRERVWRQPENFGTFLGELHTSLHDLYEAAAKADRNADGFVKTLADVCAAKGIDGWQDFLNPDEQHRFFRNVPDPQRPTGDRLPGGVGRAARTLVAQRPRARPCRPLPLRLRLVAVALAASDGPSTPDAPRPPR